MQKGEKIVQIENSSNYMLYGLSNKGRLFHWKKNYSGTTIENCNLINEGWKLVEDTINKK